MSEAVRIVVIFGTGISIVAIIFFIIWQWRKYKNSLLNQSLPTPPTTISSSQLIGTVWKHFKTGVVVEVVEVYHQDQTNKTVVRMSNGFHILSIDNFTSKKEWHLFDTFDLSATLPTINLSSDNKSIEIRYCNINGETHNRVISSDISLKKDLFLKEELKKYLPPKMFELQWPIYKLVIKKYRKEQRRN